jgi:hypothetical protein
VSVSFVAAFVSRCAQQGPLLFVWQKFLTIVNNVPLEAVCMLLPCTHILTQEGSSCMAAVVTVAAAIAMLQQTDWH